MVAAASEDHRIYIVMGKPGTVIQKLEGFVS